MGVTFSPRKRFKEVNCIFATRFQCIDSLIGAEFVTKSNNLLAVSDDATLSEPLSSSFRNVNSFYKSEMASCYFGICPHV